MLSGIVKLYHGFNIMILNTTKEERLESLSMDCSVALLVVLSFRDPHLLERVQGGQNAAADPCGIEPLLRRRDPYLYIFGSELLHLGQQAVAEALEQRGTA